MFFEVVAVLDFAITVSTFIDMIAEWRSSRATSQEVEKQFVEHCNNLGVAAAECTLVELGRGYRALYEAVTDIAEPLSEPMARARRSTFAALETRREALERTTDTMQVNPTAISERAALPDLGALETARLAAKRSHIQNLQQSTLAASASLEEAQKDAKMASSTFAADCQAKLDAEAKLASDRMPAANRASRSGWSRSRNRNNKREAE